MRKSLRALVCIVAITALAGMVAACATIMHGTSQEIGISSQPTGATVTVDNVQYGETPVVADLKRKIEHVVKIEIEGYEIFEMNITKKTSGWVWGNILFGGLIGLGVDAITGGLYNLTPEQVHAELTSTTADIRRDEATDLIYVHVVLTPDRSWQRIGTLTQLAAGH